MSQTAAKPAAHWEGKIQIPDHELSMTVDLAQNEKGAWIGSISVIGSTSIDVPLTDLVVDGASVKFAAALPQRSTFDGKLSDDGSSISGQAANMEGGVPFQLTRGGEAHVKVPPASSTLPKEFEGYWEGAIESNGRSRRVGLKLASGPGGVSVGTLFAVDQGNMEIPASTVTIKDKQLDLDARAISASYKGILNGDEIAGELTQGGGKLALTFKKKM